MTIQAYSSDEEDGTPSCVARKSSVYLGFVDADFEAAGEAPTIEDTFFGGQPIWLAEDSKPQDDLLVCKNCLGPLALILQAFSPLEGTFYDRVIYIFGCKKQACSRKNGSIRAIRGALKDPVKIAEAEKQQGSALTNELNAKLQIDDAKDLLFEADTAVANPFESSNPFSSNDNPFGNPAGSNPFEKTNTKPSYAEVGANAKPSPELKKSSNKSTRSEPYPAYPGFFVYVEQEKFNKKLEPKLPDNIKLDSSSFDTEAEILSSSNSHVNKSMGAETEGTANNLLDPVFQHFNDVVLYNPYQVLRYDLGGEPLLLSSQDETYSKVTKHLVPNPGFNPSSSRHFELQVMPKIIIDFENESEDLSTGSIEWGTIVVYTDVQDITPKLDENHVGYVEEWVGVQWEESLPTKN